MKTLRIVIFLIIGFSAINAIPTPKPTPKPTLKPAEIKKSLIVEEAKADNPIKPKISVENAETPKNIDRAKKSASTTFCVEIRPSATDGPHKVCDPPVPSQPEHHDHHEVHDNPPSPINTVEPEFPFFVIPPSPIAIYDSYLQPEQPASINFVQPQPPSIAYIQPQSPPSTIFQIAQTQQDPLPVQHLSPTAQIIYPPYIGPQSHCPPPPCPPSPCGTYGIHRPHAQVTLYRSSNGSPMDDLITSLSPDSKMEMKSNENDGKTSVMDGEMAGSTEVRSMLGPETVGTIFGRTHRKQYPGLYPIYPSLSNGCQQSGQIIVPQYPQISTGCGSTIFVGSARQNDEALEEASSMRSAGGLGSMKMDQSQMSMDMGQARTYGHYPSIVQPMIGVLPATGFNPNPMIYQPSTGFKTYQGRYDPYHSQSMVPVSSGTHSMYRKDHHSRQHTQNNDENEKKNDSEEKTSQSLTSMSPSKMLNEMRGQESHKTSPMMQSFPREKEARQMEKGTHINVHIPSGGQAYLPGGKNSNDEKILENSKHEEIGKRGAESPSIDDIEA